MVSVSCFGVRVSVMFHFMVVHYTFSSVSVAEWPPFGKQLPARFAICSHCTMQSDGLAHLSKVYSVIAGACIPIFHCILNFSA